MQIQTTVAANADPRVYCHYKRLVSLKKRADLLQIKNILKSKSILSGQHMSRFRGRGLNFEELKHYQQGDDIRNIDWKVTMRTGKPHVRTYTEEKDQHIMLCVDQRPNMFFASINTMKSVVAAEISALIAWAVVKENDRVSFTVFNDQSIYQSKAKRSQKDLLFSLSQLCEFNHQLSASQAESDKVTLNNVIDSLLLKNMHSAMIVILSDFYHLDDDCIEKIKYLQQSNNVLCVMISDDLEKSFSLEKDEQWVISDGSHQFNVETHSNLETVNKNLLKDYQQKKDYLTQLMAMNHFPFIEITTDGHHLSIFEQGLRS